MKYKAGDYLAVLPINPPASVRRAMRRFGLAVDAHLEITTTASGTTTLPVDRSVPASDVLGSYVELSQPATKRVSAHILSYKSFNPLFPLVAFFFFFETHVQYSLTRFARRTSTFWQSTPTTRQPRKSS